MANNDRIQIFISYRRQGGSAFAGRISDRLSSKYNVFFDMETMHSGKFNAQIIKAIEQCDDLVLVLPPNGLDRCVNEDDWVRKEIYLALNNKKNIVPVILDGFVFPESLPSDIEQIRYIECIRGSDEYFDSVVKKIESFLTCGQEHDKKDPFAVGSIVGNNYQISCELGQGGSAVVYLAHDIRRDMMVAIKRVCKDKFTDFVSARESLMCEFNIQKMCRHSGIANVHDFFEYNDEFAIVMDYIAGDGLNQLIEKHGFLSENDVLRWGIQICSTLSYLHNMGSPLYLCDIKPSNIIINSNSDAILIDFGVSKHDMTFHAGETTVLGTSGYAAPEQMARNVDGRTDIYGLGQTLYHALTGRSIAEPPYENIPVRQIRPTLSKNTERIIARCVLLNPEKRYQTADELKTDMERALEKNNSNPWYNRIFGKKTAE